MTETFFARFRAGVESERRRSVLRFLGDGEVESERLDAVAIDQRARAIAARLLESHAPGERALLLYLPGLEFVSAFLGCLYAKVIAVPIYPSALRRSGPFASPVEHVAADSGATAALTTAALATATQAVAEGQLARAELIVTDTLDLTRAEGWSSPRITSTDVAFLQYTSGSTAAPKGVIVNHGNLADNISVITTAMQLGSDTRAVSWLPTYHDMGLIGMVLTTLHMGSELVLMSPLHFLQRPIRWLAAITKYEATVSGAPSFAYELCARRSTPEHCAALRLDSWEVAFTGAEPIRADTLRRFEAAFAGCGFRGEALFPCYGLAESTLFVTGVRPQTGFRALRFAERALEAGIGEPAAQTEAAARELVSCGRPGVGLTVRIVDPETSHECASGRIGEILVRGASLARGYWGHAEDSAGAFQGGFAGEPDESYLRTGDLGFLRDGELFITGRLKDLVIVNGRNIHPHDVESTVEQADPLLRPGGGAVFGIEVEEGEALVVLHEAKPGANDWGAVLKAITQRVNERHAVSPEAIWLLWPGQLPKTSSGKVRRSAAKQAFLGAELSTIARWRRGSQVEISPARPGKAARPEG